MYLALLLSPESEAELRRHAVDAPADLHLTVIHSKQDLAAWEAQSLGGVPSVARKMALPVIALPIRSTGFKLDTFGPPTKRVRVLQVEGSTQLWELRRRTEALLRAAYIPWSMNFNWQPHLTLGKSGYSGTLPLPLTFDRLEWR